MKHTVSNIDGKDTIVTMAMAFMAPESLVATRESSSIMSWPPLLDWARLVIRAVLTPRASLCRCWTSMVTYYREDSQPSHQ